MWQELRYRGEWVGAPCSFIIYWPHHNSVGRHYIHLHELTCCIALLSLVWRCFCHPWPQAEAVSWGMHHEIRKGQRCEECCLVCQEISTHPYCLWLLYVLAHSIGTQRSCIRSSWRPMYDDLSGLLRRKLKLEGPWGVMQLALQPCTAPSAGGLCFGLYAFKDRGSALLKQLVQQAKLPFIFEEKHRRPTKKWISHSWN